jgi:hypothetical protein
MAKDDKKKVVTGKSTQSKKRKIPDITGGTNKSKGEGGIDEFDMLFSDKKKQDKQTKEEEAKREAARKAAKKARYKNDGAGSSSKKNQSTDASGTDWVDDGLGGKFNKEGYTGRIEDGIKIFKRHILNKPGAGNTKDCPFDCSCCFI